MQRRFRHSHVPQVRRIETAAEKSDFSRSDHLSPCFLLEPQMALRRCDVVT
jgi:hypothetical protein